MQERNGRIRGWPAIVRPSVGIEEWQAGHPWIHGLPGSTVGPNKAPLPRGRGPTHVLIQGVRPWAQVVSGALTPPYQQIESIAGHIHFVGPAWDRSKWLTLMRMRS